MDRLAVKLTRNGMVVDVTHHLCDYSRKTAMYRSTLRDQVGVEGFESSPPVNE